MSAPMNRKRKAEIFVEENERKATSKTESSSGPAGQQLHLPSPVWGRVLDYMPYQEVRSALLICKSIGNEAVKYVHTFNIMRDCELDVPSARRFSSVEHVNILCLIKEGKERNEIRNWIISHIATKSTVSFLQAFPRLSSMFVGGLIGGEKKMYSPYNCVEKKHFVLFRSLISTFVGAFRTRTLSQELSLLGVVDSGYLYSKTHQCRLEREEGESHNDCQWCRDVCKYLPLKDPEVFQTVCLDNETRDSILLRRKGGSNTAFIVKVIKLTQEILDGLHWHRLDHSDRELRKKLIDMGFDVNKSQGDGNPQYLPSYQLEEIDDLAKSLRIRPCDIPRELFYKYMCFGDDGREWDIFCQSTVDNLIARGYPIDPKDLIIVDETKEPALQRIIRESKHRM